jgi:hypothetical protein
MGRRQVTTVTGQIRLGLVEIGPWRWLGRADLLEHQLRVDEPCRRGSRLPTPPSPVRSPAGRAPSQHARGCQRAGRVGHPRTANQVSIRCGWPVRRPTVDRWRKGSRHERRQRQRARWRRRISQVIAHFQRLLTTATLPACRRAPVSRNEPCQRLVQPLIPRQREQQEIVRRLLDDRARLLTRVGSPGAGKTRLAIIAARSANCACPPPCSA